MRTQLRAQLDSMVREYREMVARLDGMSADVAALTATVSSPDRGVTVTVGARGELTGLVIDPQLTGRLDARALARKIVETADRAAAQVRDRARATMVDVFPERLRHAVGPDATVDLGALLGREFLGGAGSGPVGGGH